MRFEVILWQDAGSVDEWTPSTEITPKEYPVITIGLLVMEDRKTLVVAGNWESDNDNYSCIMHIPKSCITRRFSLKLPAFFARYFV